MCNINAYTEAIKVFLTREPQEMAGNAGCLLTKNEKTLILQYLTCSSAAAPRGSWLSFIQLPDGPHHHQPFVLEAIEPLAREFGNDFGKFLARSREMGGVETQMGVEGQQYV